MNAPELKDRHGSGFRVQGSPFCQPFNLHFSLPLNGEPDHLIRDPFSQSMIYCGRH